MFLFVFFYALLCVHFSMRFTCVYMYAYNYEEMLTGIGHVALTNS